MRHVDDSKRLWTLMTTDFRWSCGALREHGVDVHFPDGTKRAEEVKLQPFEVVVAVVFARLRPDYDWWVTPNRPDGGIDFIGRGAFLRSSELGIDAAITIGGQCKKRDRVHDIVSELSGSFIRMANTLHPTFFVAAISNDLATERIAAAKDLLEKTLQRHCHILNRKQIEALIADNFAAAQPIVRTAFSNEDAAFVSRYFGGRSAAEVSLTMQVSAPSVVLAGEAFRVAVQITRNSLAQRSFRLRWIPTEHDSTLTLVVPIAAASSEGIALDFGSEGNTNPFVIEQSLEFLLYPVGAQRLGSIEICTENLASPIVVERLPAVEVADNLRPPFYDAPYREPLDELQRGLVRARAGKVSCVGLMGAGGAGKTRLCEEMCLEARRKGATIVSARQAHSAEFPRRILANLLISMLGGERKHQTAADHVDETLSRLEPKLAAHARNAIEILLGQAGRSGSPEDDQALLSVFVVLIAERARSSTVVVHLHDLHWCTRDVLETIERLIWQLGHVSIRGVRGAPPGGIRALFILEGRRHEHRDGSEVGWTTHVFERFIERIECPVARCRAFQAQESITFAQRIFEQSHSANQMLSSGLGKLQDGLIAAVHRVAGGNPLHMLEQVKLFQQHGIVAQNPRTGFMYLTKPDFTSAPIPVTVFETIEARWRYYQIHQKGIATLLWAVALADDNLPPALFQYLWSRLAPEATQPQIESTEFLHFPRRTEEGVQVSFRHENYFQAIRGIQLTLDERAPVVEAFSAWFTKARYLDPGLRYVEAKVELEAPRPDFNHARRVLRAARESALRRRDRGLASRIIATLLDQVTWPSDQNKPLSASSFIRACDDEVALCSELVAAGDTDVAYERIRHVVPKIASRMRAGAATSSVFGGLNRRRFTLLGLQAQILYHDRKPAEALEITDDAVRQLESLHTERLEREREAWRIVTMEVRNIHSVAVALAGDMPRAVEESRKAARIAEMFLETSPEALDVVITYANILLCEAPEESEAMLLEHLELSRRDFIPQATRLDLDLNLAMARIVLGHRKGQLLDRRGENRLTLADDSLELVFREAYHLGRLAQAAAAALLLGLVRALRDQHDDIDWFSQAASLAIRARQRETLWRAYINLAHSLHRRGQPAGDAASAAFDIMSESLASYAEPDRTPRFGLLAVPMAHATRYVLLRGDEKATKAFQRFPALRAMFSSIERGELKDDRNGWTSHEWLRCGSADYVIY